MNSQNIDVSKICPKCGQSKLLEQFGKSICYCTDCERKRGMEKYFKYKDKYQIRAKIWRDTHKEQSNAISRKAAKKMRVACKTLRNKIVSENPCIVCKESRIGCLDFHHLNPNEKEKVINKSSSISDLLQEVSKCIVLCANCHRLFHNGDITLPINVIPIDVTKWKS